MALWSHEGMAKVGLGELGHDREAEAWFAVWLGLFS